MMKNISIKYKLFIGFLLIAVLFIPLSIYTATNSNKLNQQVLTIVDNSIPRIEALLKMKYNATQIGSLVDKFRVQPIKNQTEINAKKDELLAYLEEMNRWANEYQSNFDTKTSAFDINEFVKLRDAVVFSALNAFAESHNGTDINKINLRNQELVSAENALNNFIEGAELNEKLNLETTKSNTEVMMNQIYQITILVNAIVIALALALGLIMSRYISRPIINLTKFAKNISADNLDQRASVSSADEIGQLANTINRMLDHLSQAKNDLIDVSREAGKAEVATSILHNVGNILNSVIVSTSMVRESNLGLKLKKLDMIASLLQENLGNINHYLTIDEKGKIIPGYLKQLSTKLISSQEEVTQELNNVIKKLGDIKNIINMQQSHTKVVDVKQTIRIPDMIDDIIDIFADNIKKSKIIIEKNFSYRLPVTTAKTKLQQILVNLIKNAIDSLESRKQEYKMLSFFVDQSENQCIKIVIQDNGLGISEENRMKIFNFGFTTKKEGHGFGLHSCALLANELGGELKAESAGLNQGARFILKIKDEKLAIAKPETESEESELV